MSRVDWIDELKGFILVLVCLGHTHVHLSFGFGDLIIMSQAFRMTTFFFLSGTLFSIRRYPNIKSYLNSKIKVLLIPYVLLSVLFTFLDPRLYDVTFINRFSYLNFISDSSEIHSSFDFFIMELISIFYQGIPITVGPMWFVLTLFGVNVLFFIVHHLSCGNKKYIMAYALFCLMIGWYCSQYRLYLPYNLATIFTASFFFTLGFLMKKVIKILVEETRLRLGLIISLLFVIYFYAININGAISLTFNNLGANFFGYILSTVSGIFFIVIIFICISKYIRGSIFQGVLKNIAGNALIILPVHYWTILCCRIFFYPIAKENYFPYMVTLAMIVVTTLAIPLFRSKLYWLIGKKKITLKESLTIK